MTVYRLRNEEVTLVNKTASMYAEAPTTYRSWCPIKTVDTAYYIKDYVLNRFEDPEASREGARSAGVATGRTEYETDMVFFKYKFEFPAVEVASARRNGVPLQTDNIRVGMSQINLAIERLIYQGMDDPIAINGMLDDGEDVDAGLDDDKWDTIGEPCEHVLQGFTDLTANYFYPPYTMILSWNLAAGFAQKHNAAVDLSHREYARQAFQIDNIHFARNGTSTTETIYPLPAATADDGVWIMCKPSIENFYLAETGPPTVYMNPELDRDSNSFVGYIVWHGTFQTIHAGSIVYEPDVDLA